MSGEYPLDPEVQAALDDVVEALDEQALVKRIQRDGQLAYMQVIKTCCPCLNHLGQAFLPVASVAAYYYTPELHETPEDAEDFLAVCLGAESLLSRNDPEPTSE